MEKSVHTSEYAALRTELRSLRENAGMSQRDLAGKLDVPHSWVAKVESGERRIDFVELCRLIEACNESPIRILGRLVTAVSKPRARRVKGGRT